MKIDRLRAFAVTYPLATGKYRMSGGRLLEALQSTLVEVTTAEGAVGYGEACTLAGSYIEGFQGSTLAAIRELAPVVFDADAMHPAVVGARFDARIRGHAPAKSALDAALWDARGKILGQPVAALLGGIHQPSYGVFHPLSLDDPEVMAQDAHEKLALGYRSWQLKIGDDPIEDAARVKAAYDVIGESAEFVTCDANRGWTMADAIRHLACLGDLDVFVEQPCETLDELALIRPKSRQPLMADEVILTPTDLVRCYTLGAAEAINIKPARVGGITKAALLRDLAHSLGMKVVIDEPMGGEIAVAGIAHLSASTPKKTFLAASHITGTHIDPDAQPWVCGAIALVDGRAHLPPGDGLGLDIDAGALPEPEIDLSGGAL